MQIRLGIVLLLIGWLLSTSPGCGGNGPTTYPVTGTVTFNGVPLDKGQIAMRSVDGHATPTGGAIVDGKFALQSTAGEKIVEINATRESGPVNPTMGQAPREQYIPKNYNVESTLRANVVPGGPNAFDFPLTAAAETQSGGRRSGN
jgi:hypothetical protein